MGRVLGFDYITSLHHLIFLINLVQIRKKNGYLAENVIVAI